MAFVKIFIHTVWTTKNREPILQPDVLFPILEHIRGYAKEKGIAIDRVNGHRDHLHVLLWLHPEKSIGKIVQLLKGESSHWINQQGYFKKRFSWNEGYFAGSISPSVITAVRRYVDDQQNHHTRVSFQEEYQMFLDMFKESGG